MKELEEVEKKLLDTPIGPNPSKWKTEDYVGAGASRLTYLNLKVPQVRSGLKGSLSFSNAPIKEQWKVWDYVWSHSNYFEAMLAACHFANSRPIEELSDNRKKLLKWIQRVDNWAHSDELSSLYAKLLEHDKEGIFPFFEKWNRSAAPWYKRQSMVGLLFYSRFRKKALDAKTILAFVDRHIEDKHYYVQKGVGWTLRECWNLYPQTTFKYLRQNAKRIPAAGWTAATEKLPKAERIEIKAIRQRAQ